jgi:hypothetical protein
MSGSGKGKQTARIPNAMDSESVSATEVDLKSDDDEDEMNDTSLMCIVWVAKYGQRKPFTTALITVKLFALTFDEAIEHLDQKVKATCSAKFTADSTIAYQAKPCKVASKAHDLPKGFPNCIGFSNCDTEDAYISFLKLIQINIAQMKKGTEPIVQIIATVSPKPIEGGEDQSVVILEASESGDGTEGARKVFSLQTPG